jgi:hypothetical protein
VTGLDDLLGFHVNRQIMATACDAARGQCCEKLAQAASFAPLKSQIRHLDADSSLVGLPACWRDA